MGCNLSLRLASFLSTRANERSNPIGLLFSFVGGATLSSNRALPPQAAESGSHIRPKSVGELARQRRGRDIFAKGEIPSQRKRTQRVRFFNIKSQILFISNYLLTTYVKYDTIVITTDAPRD